MGETPETLQALATPNKRNCCPTKCRDYFSSLAPAGLKHGIYAKIYRALEMRQSDEARKCSFSCGFLRGESEVIGAEEADGAPASSIKVSVQSESIKNAGWRVQYVDDERIIDRRGAMSPLERTATRGSARNATGSGTCGDPFCTPCNSVSAPLAIGKPFVRRPRDDMREAPEGNARSEHAARPKPHSDRRKKAGYMRRYQQQQYVRKKQGK